MSDTEQEVPVGDTGETVTVDVNGEVVEPDDGLEDDESPIEDDDPLEDDAEAEAAAERQRELAAERQAEEQSLEAQQREQDAKNKKLVQQATHLAKRYSEILGPDLDGFVACPLCSPWFPGIRLPVMPDYDTVAAVKVAIGEDPDPPLTNDHYSKQCEACAGLGKVLTGSHVTGQQTGQCIPCKGRGWIAIGPEREAGNLIQTNGGVTPDAQDTSGLPPDTAAAAEALRALDWIVVPPVNTPESIAAQSGQ